MTEAVIILGICLVIGTSIFFLLRYRKRRKKADSDKAWEKYMNRGGY